MDAYHLALSIDLDEWYHSRRWVDGGQKVAVPDMPALFEKLYRQPRPSGDVVAPTRALLDLLDRHRCRCTFFTLGEMGEWYPDLIREIVARGHELGCHGMHHVDMTVLGPDEFRRQLTRAAETLDSVAGVRPRGYRAPNLVYAPWATRILEETGFEFDASVCVSRPIGGKYKGWAGAPLHPYHPGYDNVAVPGDARLMEVPLPCFPVLRLSAGSGIITRIVGYRWTSIALSSTIRTGHTSYYFHPWEVGVRPRPDGHWLKNRIFLRRTGPWMLRAVDRILTTFADRIVPVGECVRIARAELSAPAFALPTPTDRVPVSN
ncbi:MAG TPA: polysaccharide deacetylase family protein [Vicinamibacterales bacterium]|nr:polysaccharide deacetylase family protein [Vicinamibacterales bacterium]